MRSRHWILLAFVIMGTALFLLQDIWLVRDIDDYGFSTLNELALDECGNSYIVHNKPVLSLGDAVASQRVAYTDYNGRFLIHTMSQWFNSMRSNWPAILLNTVAWATLLACFASLALNRKRLLAPWLAIAFAVIWLTMPNALVMMIGSITAAADYLWTGAASLFILWLFNKIRFREERLSLLLTVLIGLAALIAGAMQESFSIGISAGLVLFALINRRRMSRGAWVLVICYVIGTLLVTLAPANFKRSDMMGHMIRWYALKDLLKVPVVLLTLLTAVITLFAKPGVFFDTMRNNTVILIAIAVNLVFAVGVAYTGAWQLTCISLLCAILMLQMASQVFTNKVFVKIVALLAVIAVTAVYAAQFNYRRAMSQVEQSMYRQALDGRSLIDLNRAFDIDAPYRQSPLAPLYRQLLRNPFETLIINNQQNGVSLLSKFLTRCDNPDLVQALLPEIPDKIAGRFPADGSVRVGDAEATELPPFTVTRGETENADRLDGIIVPCQQWEYDGKWYKLYNKPVSTLQGSIE